METFEELIDLQIAAQEKAMKKAWYYKINGVLVKSLKPCHENDRVHIHCWDGCYNVHSVDVNGFTIRKNGKFIYLPWTEFRCKSGNGSSPIKYEKLRDREIISKINTEIRILEKTKAELKGKWGWKN
jgi:hypothetical protein